MNAMYVILIVAVSIIPHLGAKSIDDTDLLAQLRILLEKELNSDPSSVDRKATQDCHGANSALCNGHWCTGGEGLQWKDDQGNSHRQDYVCSCQNAWKSKDRLGGLHCDMSNPCNKTDASGNPTAETYCGGKRCMTTSVLKDGYYCYRRRDLMEVFEASVLDPTVQKIRNILQDDPDQALDDVVARILTDDYVKRKRGYFEE